MFPTKAGPQRCRLRNRTCLQSVWVVHRTYCFYRTSKGTLILLKCHRLSTKLLYHDRRILSSPIFSLLLPLLNLLLALLNFSTEKLPHPSSLILLMEVLSLVLDQAQSPLNQPQHTHLAQLLSWPHGLIAPPRLRPLLCRHRLLLQSQSHLHLLLHKRKAGLLLNPPLSLYLDPSLTIPKLVYLSSCCRFDI